MTPDDYEYVTELREEIHKLKRHLETYGNHLDDCPHMLDGYQAGCLCGFSIVEEEVGI